MIKKHTYEEIETLSLCQPKDPASLQLSVVVYPVFEECSLSP